MRGYLTIILLTAVAAYETKVFQQVIDSSKYAQRLQFTVVAIDEAKSTNWTCLRLEFAMKSVVNVNGTDMEFLMDDATTVNNKGSTCTSLNLDLNGPDTKQKLTLDFTIEQSQKDKEDVTIFYLQELHALDLQYTHEDLNTTTSDSTMISFVKQGPLNPNITDNFTPVEADMQDSFKCFLGFTTKGTTQTNNLDVRFEFHEWRLELNEQPTKINIFTKLLQDQTLLKWKPTTSCDHDISTVLPIIVGCVLAIIVVMTIAGYIVARKRSSHVYEEI